MTINLKVGGVIGTLVYLACGMLYHLLDADVFSWADPWLYVTMILWPLFLFGWFLLICIIIVVIVLAFLFAGDWLDRRRRGF